MGAADPVHSETIRRYFTGAADRHTEGYQSATRAGYFYSLRRQLVAQLLEETEGESLLDAGCGSAPLEPTCRAAGFRYTGVDVDSRMIEAALAASPDGDPSNYAVGHIEDLDFPSGSFDVVLALGVLEYVEPGEIDTAVRELARVLDDGGTLILSLLNSWSPIWAARRWSQSARHPINRLRGRSQVPIAPETLFSRAKIRSLLGNAGLAERTATTYGYALVPSRLYALRPPFWAGAALRLERLGPTPLRAMGMGHLITATKIRAGAQRNDATR